MLFEALFFGGGNDMYNLDWLVSMTSLKMYGKMLYQTVTTRGREGFPFTVYSKGMIYTFLWQNRE